MNLYEKIAAVMKEVEYLTKDDSVATGGGKSYKAISDEKVITSIRPALIKNGLVILPIVQEHKREDERLTDNYGKEKINRLTTVNTTYRIVDIEKPESYIDVVSSGTGVDTQDKGVGKAMTYAYKYMLLRTFAIPTGDDADKISSEGYTEGLYGKPQPSGASDNKKADDINKEFDPPKVELATPEQIRQLQEACFMTGTEEAAILKAYKKSKLENLTAENAAQAIRRLNAKADGAA